MRTFQHLQLTSRFNTDRRHEINLLRHSSLSWIFMNNSIYLPPVQFNGARAISNSWFRGVRPPNVRGSSTLASSPSSGVQWWLVRCWRQEFDDNGRDWGTAENTGSRDNPPAAIVWLSSDYIFVHFSGLRIHFYICEMWEIVDSRWFYLESHVLLLWRTCNSFVFIV